MQYFRSEDDINNRVSRLANTAIKLRISLDNPKDRTKDRIFKTRKLRKKIDKELSNLGYKLNSETLELRKKIPMKVKVENPLKIAFTNSLEEFQRAKIRYNNIKNEFLRLKKEHLQIRDMYLKEKQMISFDDYVEKNCYDLDCEYEEYLDTVDGEIYTVKSFSEFAFDKYESSYGDYCDRKYDEYKERDI